MESLSRKTRRKDTTTKPELYARLGVKEYFLFDPDREYLDPPLQGYRLRVGAARVGDASRLLQQLRQIGPERRTAPAPLDAGDEAVDRLRVLLLAFPQEPEALPSQG